MRGSITASCGHVLADNEELHDVIYQEQTREGDPAIAYASFCPRCAIEWRQKGWLFADADAASAWLAAQL